MRIGAAKPTTRHRRTSDEIARVLSNAQREWLRPLLLEKLRRPSQPIPYKHIAGLALFREFRTTRRLEYLIRAELQELQRLAQVEARHRQNRVDEQRRAQEEKEQTKARVIQDAVQRALEAQGNEYDKKIDALKIEHRAFQVDQEGEKARLRQELSELRVVEEKLRSQLQSAVAMSEELRYALRHATDAKDRRKNDHASILEKYHATREALEIERADVAALKAKLHSVEEASRLVEARETAWSKQQHESALEIMATVTALKAAESRLLDLEKDLRVFRAGPDLETKMRALMWACRRLSYEATMDEVRRELARAYVDAYERVHEMKPRRLFADVEALARDWWVQRCQIAHKTDHGVDILAYEDRSRRLDTVLAEIDAALIRGQPIRFSMGPLQFLDPRVQ